MIILGIDPGYDRCGWGVIRKERAGFKYSACGLITTTTKDGPKNVYQNPNSKIQIKQVTRRLAVIASELRTILERYEPDVIAIESLFFSKNKKTALGVAEARGAILSTIANWSDSVEIQEFTPMQIKLAVTGSGGADKKGVEKMIRLQLKDIPEKLIDDTLDALATALVASPSFSSKKSTL